MAQKMFFPLHLSWRKLCNAPDSADTVAEQKLREQKLGMAISYSSVIHGTAQG